MTIEFSDKKEVIYHKKHRISVGDVKKANELWYFAVTIETPVDAPAVQV
jgi:hypothetical protein